jgi:O-antigen/teichoic acid export membrane protein
MRHGWLMLLRSYARDAYWTLANQAIVSVGSFALNVVLARRLAPDEYGTFAILFSVMLTLQIFNGSLLFYPLLVRGAVARAGERGQLLAGGLLLVAGLTLPLGIGMAAVVLLFGRLELLGATLASFFLWQAQEALRRCLFAEMRHRDACLGDAIAYLGQVIAVVGLVHLHMLTLTNAFYAIAATKALASVIQARQVRLAPPRLSKLRGMVADFWGIGRWSLLNNIIATLRLQMFPWVLALAHGPGAAAGFQAMVNLVNLVNPVVIGLSNIIPQQAARGRAEQGNAHAWRTTRGMMILGAAPLAAYFACSLLAPGLMLWLFYGTGSPYLGLGVTLQILTLAAIANYPADIVCSYLHGIDESRLAMLVNVAGASTALVLGVPLTATLGVEGSCVALALASGLRSLVAAYLLVRVTAEEPVFRV